MLIDIIMPKMGESIMDGRILKWYKKPGEAIAKDETLFDISTDKVDTEIPSSDAGVVVELLFNEGDVANVGDVVARIETDQSKAVVKTNMIKSQPKKETDEDKAADLSSDANRKPFEIKGDNVEDAKIGFLSPLVMNIARKENISPKELTLIKGTGIGGRIRKQDILDYCEKKKSKGVKITSPASDHPAKVKSTATNAEMHAMYKLPGIQVLQMDNLQQKMSDHMVMSVHTSPHVSATAECDMSAVYRLRKELNEEFYGKEGFKLTYMPFICDAVIKALKDFPLVNSSIDGRNILIKKFINLGIAVAMDNGGLIVPVIKNADSMNYIGIARAINDLSGRARIKKLTLEEIQDGTFTISNYGIFGNDTGIPIINQPQIAILGTGAVKKRAVVIENHDNDSIAIKPTMYLTLSFDHRLIDGALGGKFLMKIIEYLQNYTL